MMTCGVQEAAERKAEALDTKILDLEACLQSLHVKPAVSSQPSSNAAGVQSQTPLPAVDVTAPAASMEVNVGSPVRVVSFLALILHACTCI